MTFTDNHNGTATISGIPQVGTAGTHSVIITAQNGVIVTQTLALTINQPPIITSAATIDFALGMTATPFSVMANLFGFPVPTSLTETGLPANSGLTFTNNGNGTATLRGKPTSLTSTTYILTITAHNGILPDSVQTFDLAVG